MTVRASPVEILNGTQRLRLGWVAARVVAGVADARHARFQQLRVVAAVRLMTVGAVFHDRRVLPEEGTAALGVAAQAVLVDARLQELAGVGATVWVMATGASHLALAIRHVRGTL